uniref:Uncharacterized protein n=1 Tax=Rhizophora mucronata TaxID=61149 RepID=A0A2P2P4J0_RHIMU
MYVQIQIQEGRAVLNDLCNCHMLPILSL